MLVAVGFIALSSLDLTGSITQNGVCPSFDARQEAFVLAQTIEQYRSAHPVRANYGNGSYSICYTSGKLAYFTFPVPFKGFYSNINSDQNFKTHSEQATYVWLGRKLTALSLEASQVQWINVVIFSQVIVCLPCRIDMQSWQQGLRTEVHTENLFLFVWDLGANGFDPATYPAGTGKPVTPEDVRNIEIQFDS
jgi:hypothetical protein